MKKKILRLWYKATCEHDFYQDKQITLIKCCKCGYESWLLTGNKCDLFPNSLSDTTLIERQLKSKTLFHS